MNVLFIVVDDLKPLLGCYGEEHIHSPNIDRLASGGTVFLNAHCQQAVCAPSRVSVMTGLRPDTTRVWDLRTRFRDQLPDVVTLPQHFKLHGYETVGLGKTFDFRSVDDGAATDAVSWTLPHRSPRARADDSYGFLNPEVVAGLREREAAARARGITGWKQLRGPLARPPVESADVPDEDYPDGAIAAEAVGLIHELSAGDRPFFMTVGFKKPHLPFNAPKRYWDLYDRGSIELAANPEMPTGAPGFHFQHGRELRRAYGVPQEGPLPRELQIDLIHGYYACVSYIDAQVGKLLDALDQTGAAGHTVVVLWGDHGWHLGDHSIWCKHTNYEQATRSPMIMASPDIGVPGHRTDAPVEFIDMFPTLCALAGLQMREGLQGADLTPLMSDTEGEVKPVAVSQYPRELDEGRWVMGYAVRDRRYRYIEWRECGPEAGIGTDQVVARELYDYGTDPDETSNLAESEAYAEVVARMRGHMADLRLGEP